jgi:hypothetical protein
MKKLSILLIGLLLVSGLAFAEFGAVTVTGSASVTWGVDLNSGATGFLNAGTSSVSIALVDKATATTTGDDGLFGTITVKDYSLKITDGAIVSALGSVTASIMVDPAKITIYSAPTMGWGNATVIETGDADIKPALTATNTIGGITINIPAGPVSLDIFVVSDGSWTSNVANDYAAGLSANLGVGPATVALGGFYGWFNATGTWGGTAKVALDVAPADVTIGVDIVDGVSWEVDLGASVDISEANADGKMTTVGLDVFYSTAADLDAKVTFTEVGAGGLVDMLASTVAVAVYDLTSGTIGWTVDADNSYDTGDMKPYLNFGYGSDSIFDLQVGVDLKAGLTGIDNTTITLDYISLDLPTDMGIITVKAAVKL